MKDPFNEKSTLCGYISYNGSDVVWVDQSGSKQYCISLE